MTAKPESPAYRRWVLLVLVLVNTFNFIDRQIIGVLAPAIKAELHLSDTQLGLLGGLAFAAFYTALGIPIAWLADRKSRVWIMTAALALWSGFTAACGLTHSFLQLFLARLGVGVGEAGGVAPAYSLISDYFPQRERARALAIYSFGIPIGSAAGILFGGLVASLVDWRWAFLTVGLAGLLLAPVFRLVLKDPPRGRYDKAPAAPQLGFAASLGRVARTPSFWGLSLGAACSSIVGYGLLFWLPSFFIRSYHFSLREMAVFLGAILLFGGIAGIWGGGWLVDKLSSRSKRAYALAPACAFLIAAPCYAAMALTSRPEIGFFLALGGQAMALVWLGPVIAAIQHLTPASMRATASAAFLFINNLIGIGVGTLFFGFLSDQLHPRFGAESLRYAVLIGLGFYLLAALLMALTSRRLTRDWVD